MCVLQLFVFFLQQKLEDNHIDRQIPEQDTGLWEEHQIL